MQEYVKMWFDDDGYVQWEGKNLSPSQLCLMGNILIDYALHLYHEKINDKE